MHTNYTPEKYTLLDHDQASALNERLKAEACSIESQSLDRVPCQHTSIEVHVGDAAAAGVDGPIR